MTVSTKVYVGQGRARRLGAWTHVVGRVCQGYGGMLSPTKQASLAKEGPFYRDSDYSSLSNRLRHSTVERARLVAGACVYVCVRVGSMLFRYNPRSRI